MRELMSYALIRPHFKRGHPTTGGQASPDEAGEGLDRFSGFLALSTTPKVGIHTNQRDRFPLPRE
ncbi:MAG: hypothetical protein CO189_00635 [candidate division Zixibacteria bacterium CG_4_9_14_3_um_filter_46_8]|nr:MAG: hypothetical protein CO189_00635 [candidate division Zixibacteria bacterium CG_4_9_14_3_um_filter_46_8]